LLAVPDNVSLLFLPPYSPELNPKENLWDEIREKIFKNLALKSMNAVRAKLREAVLYIERNPELVKSISLPLHCQVNLIWKWYHYYLARYTRALTQSRLSRLLALEVAPTGRATADRRGVAQFDPADERRKPALGRHVPTVNCSSSGLKPHNRASPSTWSNDRDHPARDANLLA
jgi:hypothetical protein